MTDDPLGLDAYRDAEAVYTRRPARLAPPPTRAALSDEDAARILVLQRRGMTSGAIAAALDLAATDVEGFLREVSDTRPAARAHLESKSLTIARALVEHAQKDGTIGLEIADRLQFLERRQHDTGRLGHVTIVIGTVGAPAGSDPIIDVSPVPAVRVDVDGDGNQ
jgi:hypothetical protein